MSFEAEESAQEIRKKVNSTTRPKPIRTVLILSYSLEMLYGYEELKVPLKKIVQKVGDNLTRLSFWVI